MVRSLRNHVLPSLVSLYSDGMFPVQLWTMSTAYSSFNSEEQVTFVTLEPGELEEASKCLLHKSPTDLSENFPCEMSHLKKKSSSRQPPFILLKEICKKQVQLIFSAVCIALWIFCKLPVTVSSHS